MFNPGNNAAGAARRHLDRLPSGESIEDGAMGPMLELYPVFFPVLEKTYSVRLDVSAELGLVDRWILEAVLEFGPIGADVLDEMLGLGKFVLAATLNRLVELGVPILETDSGYSLAENPFAENGRVISVKKHEMTFVVSGIGGELLPISFLDMHRDSETGATDVMSICKQYHHWHTLPSTHSDTPLPDVTGLSYEARQEFGVKDNFVACDPVEPIETKRFFMVAFLARFLNGVRLFTVGREEGAAGMRGFDMNWPYPKDFSSLPILSKNAGEEWKTSLKRLQGKTAARLESATPGIISVTLPDVDTTSETAMDDTRIEEALIRGNWWNFPAEAIYARLFPGNAPTARAVLLERAASDWLKNWGKRSSRKAIDEWWDGFCRNEDYVKLKEVVPVAELVRYAREKKNDSEFLEYLETHFPRHDLADEGATKPGAPGAGVLVISLPASASRDLHNLARNRPGSGAVVRDLVENARTSLEVISPMVDDPTILSLLETATARNVSVHLITSVGEDQRIQADRMFSADDKEKNRRRDALSRLARAKCLVRSPDCIPHAKLVIADKKRALLSSANLNTNSMAWDNSLNARSAEAGVIIDNPDIVRAMAGQFDVVWSSCAQRIHHQSRDAVEDFTVHREKTEIATPGVAEAAGVRVGVHFPGAPEPLAGLIAAAFARAQRRIAIASLSLYDTKDIPVLHAAFLEALRRGVKITACIRKPEDMDKYPDPSTRELLDNGLELRFIDGMHIKGLLVDDNYCGLYSANITPFSLGDPVRDDPALRQLEISMFGPAANPLLADFAALMSALAPQKHDALRTATL